MTVESEKLTGRTEQTNDNQLSCCFKLEVNEVIYCKYTLCRHNVITSGHSLCRDKPVDMNRNRK